MENYMSAQCEHVFELAPASSEVRCIKCFDFDDEMQLPVLDPEAQDVLDNEEEAQKNQLNFE